MLQKYVGLILILFILGVIPQAMEIRGQAAADAPHFTDVTVQDQNRVDQTGKPVVAGGIYTTNFKIVIGAERPEQELILETGFDEMEDVIWRLNNEYSGIDTTTWTPGNKSFSLQEIKGEADISLTARVPPEFTLDEITEDYDRHFVRSISLIKLRLPTGVILDEMIVNVTDTTMQEFERAISERVASVESSSADPKFTTFYWEMIGLANSFRDRGDVQQALDLTGALPLAAAFPVGSTDVTIFLAGIGGLAIIVAVFAVLWIRTKSASSFLARQVDSQARKLDMSLVKISRMDKALATEITQIKEDLTKLGKT